MNVRYLLWALPLCTALLVGCGGSGENQVIESGAGEIAPSEAEAQTDDYKNAMKGMEN
ncbi:MAG: hypothetical protein ACO1RT_05450 [Planctomycetaceae bacterium]